MPFFLPLLLQAYDPEIEAVMNRSRREKQAEAAAASASATRTDGRIPVPAKYAAPFQACLDEATQSPEAGVAFAQKWRIDGGSFYARHCMGFAYARAERWSPAIVAFEQAAEEAEREGEVAQSARLWAQAGNAALASGDAAKARQDFDAALARTLLAKAAQRDKAGASGVAFKKAQPASLIGEVKDLREGSCDMVAGRDWPFSIPEFKAALEANSRRRGTTALRPVTVLLVDTGYDPRMLGKAIPDASLGEVESFVSGAIARIGVNTAEQNNDPDAPEGLASSLHGSEVAATLLGGSWLEGERANIPLPKVAFASLARYSGLTREFYLDPEGVGRAYTQAWSTNPRIQIINASVSVDPPYQSFKNYLKDETVLLVAAAGNVPGAPQAFDKTALTWPGAMGGNPLHANPGLVISVGAHNPNGDALYFSRLGEMQVDLLAPGCRIPTFSYADDRITQKDRNGTSFAAPIVSLAASLLAGEALSNHAIKNRLITTVDVDGNLAEAVWSSGRLNVARALRVYEDYVAADRVTYTDADGTNPREVKGPVEIWGLAHQEEVRLCGSWIPKGDLRMLARMVRPDTPEEWKAWRYVPSYTAISSLLCPTSYPVKGSLKFEIEGGTATVDIKDVRMFAARARN